MRKISISHARGSISQRMQNVAGQGKVVKFIAIAILLIISFVLIRNIFTLVSVEDRIVALKEKINKAEKEREGLVAKQQEVGSEAFVEREARDRLGLAKEGEVVVVLPSEEYLRSLVQPLEEEKFIQEPNWKKWLELFFEP